MHHGFALRYLAEVMQWPEEIELREITWLRTMSEFKYDSYHDFLSGSRFAESLLDWLQQYQPAHRGLAYRLLKERLIFVSALEVQHLVRRAFPAHILPFLENRAAKKIECSRYLIRSTKKSIQVLEDLKNRTLFVALSDGARIDYFRRATCGLLSNEQILSAYEISETKWDDLRQELIMRTGDKSAVFETIVLMDDFTASGTTLLRQKDKQWKGKLIKICRTLKEHAALFSRDFDIIIHHYIGTSQILQRLSQRIEEVRAVADFAELFKAGGPIVSFGMLIQDDALVLPGADKAVDDFLNHYFDPAIMTKSLLLGGDHAKYGFADCGLPLVIEHNTPNNSLAVFWAESPPHSTNAVKMRPLFRRRQRHN